MRRNNDRIFVIEGVQFPFVTVVLFKDNATYHAWQCEYDIEVTAPTVEEAIASVADKIGEMIADPEYDYYDPRHKVYVLPCTMNADDFAQCPKDLSDIMSEIFEVEAPVDVNSYIFASVLPRMRN